MQKVNRREAAFLRDKGAKAYYQITRFGKPAVCPYEIPSARAEIWFEGYHVERYLQEGRCEHVSIEEGEAIHDAVRQAYLDYRKTGIYPVNPYTEYTFDPQDGERNAMWEASLMDTITEYEGDTFEVLGTPAHVTEQPNEDGTVTYTLHRRG